MYVTYYVYIELLIILYLTIRSRLTLIKSEYFKREGHESFKMTKTTWHVSFTFLDHLNCTKQTWKVICAILNSVNSWILWITFGVNFEKI
jgi:hypothetical protein